MKLPQLLHCVLAFGLCVSITACDDGGDGDTSSDSNADADTTADTTAGETTGANDIDCQVMCQSFVDLCIQTNKSTEFETNEECVTACGAWDQAGINCRYEQMVGDACDQAGNMGSSC